MFICLRQLIRILGLSKNATESKHLKMICHANPVTVFLNWLTQTPVSISVSLCCFSCNSFIFHENHIQKSEISAVSTQWGCKQFAINALYYWWMITFILVIGHYCKKNYSHPNGWYFQGTMSPISQYFHKLETKGYNFITCNRMKNMSSSAFSSVSFHSLMVRLKGSYFIMTHSV